MDLDGIAIFVKVAQAGSFSGQRFVPANVRAFIDTALAARDATS